MQRVKYVYSPAGDAGRHVHSRKAEIFDVFNGEYEFQPGDPGIGSSARRRGRMSSVSKGCRTPSRTSGATAGRTLHCVTLAGLEGSFAEIARSASGSSPDVDQIRAVTLNYGLEWV